MKNPSQQNTLGMKANLMKYLNPSSLIQPKAQRTRSQLSNIHCRSMQELDLHLNGVSQSSKQNIRSNAHHSSLYNDKQNGNKIQNLQNKSRSLSKFITFFENSNIMGQVKKQTNENKKKNYNGFSYDLKTTGNSTTGNNTKKNMKKKDKQNINYQTLTNKSQLHYISQTRSPMMTKTQTNNVPEEIQKIYRLRETIQEYKQRQSIYTQKISQFQHRQKQLCQRIEKLQKQKQSKDQKLAQYEARIRQLQTKNKQTIEKYRSKQHKSSNKQSRQHTMVIKSLKKVINQQLNKIIQLERVKIENQYLKEKLGSVVDESFSQSSFSNHDYSFQYDTQKERNKEQSLSSTIRSRSDCEFSKEMFKKTKPMKDQMNKVSQKEGNQHSGRHFKSFFQVEESPISQSEGNIMNLFKPYQSRKKNTQSKNEQIRQQQTDMIKICQPQSSFTRQAIQEVNEDENYDHELSDHKGSSPGSHDDFDQQQENSDLRQESDSILQQVDEYLTKWRNQQG